MAYSDKKNLLELVALMDAFGIHHVVLSPGSRNAPLIIPLWTNEARAFLH
jgi:2-succinyl-5-enolpyruvyl-6-hydroxy-3-cyclohexene-1-carboxylate synthase